MIVSISQPRYLPWLGYFHRIHASDLFIYLDSVQYSPRDWENRNKVKTAQGWTWLTVPVSARYRAPIPEVLIDNTQPWSTKHWKTIQTFYGATPYFHVHESGLSEIYEKGSWQRLLDLNLALTEALCGCLCVNNNRFVKASDVGAYGRGSKLILNLCKAVGASTYLSGSEGRHYLDKNAFAKAGIRIIYQRYRHPIYPQAYGDFTPFLAAIDLLFNCGPKSLRILTEGQDLVEA
jgi:hypothetical protein